MNFNTTGITVMVGLLSLATINWRASGADAVTIPKARLIELERKEAELEKMKGEAHKPQEENRELKKDSNVNPTNIAAPTVTPSPARVSQPIKELPRLIEGATIEAADLGGYYRNEPELAEQRFHKQKIKVHGKISGFEKSLLTRNYKIILSGTDA